MGVYDLTVYDVNGKIVLQNPKFNVKNSLDVSKLENGNYYINLQEAIGKSKTQKFVKE